MSSEAFSTADRALRVQRRVLRKELTAFLGDTESLNELSREDFAKRKEYFEGLWKKVVASTESCLNLIDNGDDEDGLIAEGVNEGLESLRFLMDRLNILEGDIEKRLAVVEDTKSVESLVTAIDPLVEEEIPVEVNADILSVSPTEVNGKNTGNAEVESAEDESPAVSLADSEKSKEGDSTIFEKIGELFDLKTETLKRDNVSLNSTLNDINVNIIDVKSDMNEVKSDIMQLKSDNDTLKAALKKILVL